jgi:hypothetical protein
MPLLGTLSTAYLVPLCMPLLGTVLGLWLYEPLLPSNLLFDLSAMGRSAPRRGCPRAFCGQGCCSHASAQGGCDVLQLPVGFRRHNVTPFGRLPFGMFPRRVQCLGCR